MLNFEILQELNLRFDYPLDFEPCWHCLGDIQEDTCKYCLGDTQEDTCKYFPLLALLRHPEGGSL